MRASRSSPIVFPVTQNRSTRTKTARVNRTLTSDLFDRLRLDILHCNLQPGSRLLFRDLRATYGSGQSPLREALMRRLGPLQKLDARIYLLINGFPHPPWSDRRSCAIPTTD